MISWVLLFFSSLDGQVTSCDRSIAAEAGSRHTTYNQPHLYLSATIWVRVRCCDQSLHPLSISVAKDQRSCGNSVARLTPNCHVTLCQSDLDQSPRLTPFSNHLMAAQIVSIFTLMNRCRGFTTIKCSRTGGRDEYSRIFVKSQCSSCSGLLILPPGTPVRGP